MAVVKKYGHGLFAPCRGDDQIYSAISIYVARLDQQATYGRDKVNRLSSDVRKLYLNRVVGSAGPVLFSLNAGEIWTTVAVEIGDRKCQAGPKRSSMRILNLSRRPLRSTAIGKAKKQKRNYKPKHQVRSFCEPVPYHGTKAKLATEVGTILITNLLGLTIASVNDLGDEKFRCVTL